MQEMSLDERIHVLFLADRLVVLMATFAAPHLAEARTCVVMVSLQTYTRTELHSEIHI